MVSIVSEVTCKHTHIFISCCGTIFLYRVEKCHSDWFNKTTELPNSEVRFPGIEDAGKKGEDERRHQGHKASIMGIAKQR